MESRSLEQMRERFKGGSREVQAAKRKSRKTINLSQEDLEQLATEQGITVRELLAALSVDHHVFPTMNEEGVSDWSKENILDGNIEVSADLCNRTTLDAMGLQIVSVRKERDSALRLLRANTSKHESNFQQAKAALVGEMKLRQAAEKRLRELGGTGPASNKTPWSKAVTKDPEEVEASIVTTAEFLIEVWNREKKKHIGGRWDGGVNWGHVEKALRALSRSLAVAKNITRKPYGWNSRGELAILIPPKVLVAMNIHDRDKLAENIAKETPFAYNTIREAINQQVLRTGDAGLWAQIL